ncbi:MAG: tRNA pseudouridine(38-40) synthase TruA [Bacillota bacterium]|nr:tRNA pseudouridine(38-40) synthase TruA [Bacillota bacterium]
MEKNILLTIEYDGSVFHGWQRQPEALTVQGMLEEALSTVCGKPVEINGTSRTDAGVHAYGQRASFKGDFGIPTERIAYAVNNALLSDKWGEAAGAVRVLKAENVSSDFHARFDSKGKTYVYKIYNMPEMDVFRRNYCYHIPDELDIEAMRKAAKLIEGTHDFKCFEAAGGQERETTVRTISGITVERGNRTGSGAERAGDGSGVERAEGGRGEDGYVNIRVNGDGFLYNMVRIITGTLAEVGLGKRSPEEMTEIIEGKDRTKAGHTAPPQGLYLEQIYY